MKKSKCFLIIMLLLYPIMVLASSSSKSTVDIGTALFMEAFITIHMSIFVLKPLSMIFGKEDDKKLFWTLFIARVIILLYFDFFITTSIAMVDFFAVFIGAFVVVPICAAMTKTPISRKSNQVIRTSASTANIVSTPNVMINCTKCGNTLNSANKYCTKCGAQVSGTEKTIANSQIPQKVTINSSHFDPMYSLSEEALVEEFINRELQKAGVDKNTDLIPSDILKKRKLLNIIFAILIFIYISALFFHLSIHIYILGLIILFVLYKATRNYDLIKYLKKELKARPSEKVSNIVMTTKATFVQNDSKKVFIVGALIAVVLPLVIFMNPRVFYEKMDNGYAVRFYTYGLTNFTSVTIPEKYKNDKIVSIRGNVFSNMYFVKEITLPDTITEIRGQAFKNDKQLEKINIPSNLEYLGGGAFYNCSSITSIELPETLTYIGGETFYNATSLESINIPNNIQEIRGNTFENCTSLKSINIPDSVTRIGGHAFYGCSLLKKVEITENSQLTEIGSSAFRQCNSLYNITLPNNTYVNERAFKESPTIVNYFKDTRVLNFNNNVDTSIYKYNYSTSLSVRETATFDNGNYILNVNNILVYPTETTYILGLKGKINKTINLTNSKTSYQDENILIYIDSYYDDGTKIIINIKIYYN